MKIKQEDIPYFEDREFKNIEEMRSLIVGKKVKEIYFSDGDEGFVFEFEDGIEFDFSFSGCEGEIEIRKGT